MKTDRELLELAAKAAGYEIHIWGTKGEECVARMDVKPTVRWNPLNDDGDALRLAVDLNIGFRNMGHVMTALCEAGQFNEYADGDPYAATRRAITRAAAQIQLNKEQE